MASTSIITTKRVVCFSFAAYAKNLIEQLKSLNIHVLPGLTNEELESLESSYQISFPPDLRSILQEGLPVGPHFPNWRSSSPQQIKLIIKLPILNLLRNISSNTFWVSIWGDKPQNTNEAVKKAKLCIDNGQPPPLVPVYRNCYIPCIPNVSGNPVFYIDEREVRVISYDLTRFFQEMEFLQMGLFRSIALAERLKKDAPAWAANAAKRVDFWTEVAEGGQRVVTRRPMNGWWDVVDDLGMCLEEAFWRLRDGGWSEEEVKEMMLIIAFDDNQSQSKSESSSDNDHVFWPPQT